MSFVEFSSNDLRFDADTRKAHLTISVLPNNKFVESGELLTYEIMLTHPHLLRLTLPSSGELKGTFSTASNTTLSLEFEIVHAQQEQEVEGDAQNRPVRVMVVVSCGRTTQRVRLNTNVKELLGL